MAPPTATVRALQDLTGGPMIESAWAPVDATTGAFSTSLHMFHVDGTVEWHATGGDEKQKSASADSADKAAKPAETPPYAGLKITEDVCLISYRSQSGHMLTATLNFRDGTTVGIASNEKTWVPVKGTFEALG